MGRFACRHSLPKPNIQLVEGLLRRVRELNGWIHVHDVQAVGRQRCTPQASPVSAVAERQLEDGGECGPVKATAEAGKKGRCGAIKQQGVTMGGFEWRTGTRVNALSSCIFWMSGFRSRYFYPRASRGVKNVYLTAQYI